MSTKADDSTTYGFIGLGLMGLPMCKNIASKAPAGSLIRIYDLNAEAMNEIEAEFPSLVIKCSSPVDVASGASVIITMLPEGHHVETVFFTGPTALTKTSLDNKLLIDCSTIEPATSLRLGDDLRAQFPTAHFYDAPVSGGTNGATRGTLSFFVGCAAADTPFTTRVQPILRLMGKQMIPCGGPSLGLTAKLCNNYLSGILTIAVSETFNIGMRAGLDPRKLYEVLGAGSAQSTICDKFCPVPGVDPDSPSSHGYEGGFRVGLMRKDFRLATEMADRAAAERIMGVKALEMYEKLSQEDDYQNLDVRAMFRYIGGQEDWKADGSDKQDT